MLKNSLVNTFELIIVRARQTELQTRCLAFLRRIKLKKTNYKPKTLGFFINCSFHWPMPASQVLVPQPSYRHSTESSSVTRTSYLSYVSSGTRFEPNWVMRAHTESASVLCVWGSQSCRNQTTRLEKSGRKDWRATMKRLMEYCTTRGYFLSQKPSEQSSSVDTTTTLWQDISVSIKPRTSSAGNTIGRASEKMLRPMSRAVTYAWAQRQSDTSPMETCNPCLYRLIDGKTSRWILSLDYQSQPTGKVTVMTPS